MKIKKYFLLLIPCFVLLVGCGKKTQNREIISMAELLGESDSADTMIFDEDTLTIEPITFQGKLTKELSQHYKINPLNKQTLFDRFSYNKSIKSSLSANADSSLNSDLYMYHFSDSASLYNAFNNWLDCFGSSCVEISMLNNKKRVEEEPLWCGVYDTTVVILKFTPQSFPQRNELKSHVFKAMQMTPLLSFEVDIQNELKWR